MLQTTGAFVINANIIGNAMMIDALDVDTYEVRKVKVVGETDGNHIVYRMYIDGGFHTEQALAMSEDDVRNFVSIGHASSAVGIFATTICSLFSSSNTKNGEIYFVFATRKDKVTYDELISDYAIDEFIRYADARGIAHSVNSRRHIPVCNTIESVVEAAPNIFYKLRENTEAPVEEEKPVEAPVEETADEATAMAESDTETNPSVVKKAINTISIIAGIGVGFATKRITDSNSKAIGAGVTTYASAMLIGNTIANKLKK